MIFQAIVFILFFSYAALITAITLGWWKLKVYKSKSLEYNTKVTILVAVRNEAENIGMLIKSLSSQNYPANLFEVIFIDDHSTDETVDLVNNQIRDLSNFKLLSLQDGQLYGKKAAITQGISTSIGELILITDADCVADILWVSTLVSFYEKYSPHLILGPVCMINDGSLFGKFQSLEFSSLISSAVGSCNAGFPLMANGANMAFTREAFDTCNGFAGNFAYPSGDDMFLLMKIKKQYGAGAIRFLRSAAAIVNTPATLGFKEFIQQRLRWVSKSSGYTDPLLIASSLIVFLANVLIVVLAFLAFMSPGYILPFVIVYFFKFIVDFPLMFSFNKFQKSGKLLFLFPFSEFLNAVYTLFIGIAGNVWKYEWKGRQNR
jgi:cellulose synthase/poly-beta-1,6-N-acetylglucosamine synthase-like glycosyltransferase